MEHRPNRYASVKQLAERYGVHEDTVWRMSRRGEIPKPVKFSARCVRWDLEAVEKRDAERVGRAADAKREGRAA